MSEQIAMRDWYTRARVRILETTMVGSPEGGKHTFLKGYEQEMIQWGIAGREVRRDAWWTSFDIDGAYIIRADRVEVLEVLDEVLP